MQKRLRQSNIYNPGFTKPAAFTSVGTPAPLLGSEIETAEVNVSCPGNRGHRIHLVGAPLLPKGGGELKLLQERW